ncbi:unnamed protein product [Camellia sinensis]
MHGYYALFAIPVVCYIIAFTLSGILFIWFNPSGQDCGLNVFFLVMTMILAFAFAVIALHPQLEQSSYLLVGEKPTEKNKKTEEKQRKMRNSSPQKLNKATADLRTSSRPQQRKSRPQNFEATRRPEQKILKVEQDMHRKNTELSPTEQNPTGNRSESYCVNGSLSSEPRDYVCHGLHNKSAVTTSTLLLGKLTTVLSVLYSALRAGSTTTFLSPPSSPKSATLDILILILILILGLFSGTFLITSYFSYIFQSLSLLLPPLSHSSPSSSSSAVIYLIGFLLFFILVFVFFEICCGYRSRTCENPRCKALKKAMEFDLQLQAEECLRSAATAVREIDELPWKGGSEGNPDYECLRAELRKMAPPNGRAVLLFRARCGYPIAKLKDWGAKRGRPHKK